MIVLAPNNLSSGVVGRQSNYGRQNLLIKVTTKMHWLIGQILLDFPLPLPPLPSPHPSCYDTTLTPTPFTTHSTQEGRNKEILYWIMEINRVKSEIVFFIILYLQFTITYFLTLPAYFVLCIFYSIHLIYFDILYLGHICRPFEVYEKSNYINFLPPSYIKKRQNYLSRV